MPSPGGRWRGAAVTDEGDHGGASVVDGRTSVSAHDDHRIDDTHPHPALRATFPQGKAFLGP